MVSSTARLLTRILAVLYTVLGLILFIAPEWSSQNFAWKVSPWVAMTIGGWSLGTAYFAWKSAQVWRWSATYSCLIYLWSFGLLEALVLVLFRDKLLNGPLAWLYIATLAVNLLCAVIGLTEWYRLRPKIRPEGRQVVTWVRVFFIVALTFVALATIAMLVNSAPIVEGQILPEKVSLFTVYAFAMFYIALFLAGLTVIRIKDAAPLQLLSQGGIALMIPITAAALVFFYNVNFGEQLGILLYIVIYLILLVSAIAVVLNYRSNSVK